MAGMPSDSIDAIITDPPYETGFMGKGWDQTGIANDAEMWRDAYRVLKPGGYLLSFGGNRTYHRMASAVEDAGFEIRDCIDWLYGTGFPKSLNCGEGRGTALKPGKEPIVVARKRLIGTVAENIAAHGTGALNIDVCRIETAEDLNGGAYAKEGGDRESYEGWRFKRTGDAGSFTQPPGRWPANVVMDEDSAAELDEQAGEKGGGFGTAGGKVDRAETAPGIFLPNRGNTFGFGDRGGPSRFFYCAKASRSEREYGCSSLPLKTAGEITDRKDGTAGLNSPRAGAGRTSGGRNTHPTVKPVSLMRWLVRLVTPPGGLVFDPFTGSGTTGIACAREGVSFIGSEIEADSNAIARARIGCAYSEEYAKVAA